MFDYLIDNNNIDIENYEKVFIQRLIKGEITACDNSEYFYEPWIFEIVANKKNSIDVDKFDYICRDAYHIGLESSFVDYERIFKTSKIINNTLCYNVKNDFNLFFLFQSRHKLFKQIYRHKKVVAVDLMVKDMLILSNDYFKFTEAIFNPEEYVKLDDGIIHQIEKFKICSNPNLTKAYKIVNRLRNRDIYGFVGEFIIQKDIQCIIKLEDIITYDNPKDEYHLTLDDLEIVEITNDYGNKDKNPFDSIFFYKDENPNQSYTIPSSKISMLIPSIFRETSVALYCKDENKRQRAYQVFEKYKKQLIGNSHSVNLPNTHIPTPEKNNKFTNMKREASQDLQEILKNTI
jgi:HD superfamily phosphohydrolase